MDWFVFAICLTSCTAAGSMGAAFPPGPWYLALNHPWWTPPNWVFPLTWTTLYIVMSVAAARVAPLEGSGTAIALWGLQIALNAIWSPVFFGLRRFGTAIIVVVALWLAVAATMVALWQLDPVAGWMFVPYLIWCTIASALNVAMWRRNPDIEPVRQGV